MEKSLVQIHASLQKLIGLHRQLLDVVRAEREALTQASLSGIQEATCAKEALVETIRIEESARIKEVAAIAMALMTPARELTLSNLIIAVQTSHPKLSEQLRSSYNALLVLTQRIAEQNRYNSELIARSLGHLYQMKNNVLGEAVPAAATYGSHGKKVNPTTSAARLISQEA